MATTNLNLPTLASADAASNFPAAFNDAMDKLDAAYGGLKGVKTKTEDVTTSAGGNATTSLNPQNVILLSAYTPSDTNKICTPFRANANTFSLHITDTAGNAVASSTVSVTLSYIEK